MHTMPYTEIEHAEKSDIGKICLMGLGCSPMAIEDTLAECIATANKCGSEIEESNVDDRTDLYYLKNGDLVAVEIVDVEE